MKYLFVDFTTRDGDREYGDFLWTEIQDDIPVENSIRKMLETFYCTDDDAKIEGDGWQLSIDLFEQIIKVDSYTRFDTKEKLIEHILQRTQL